MNFRGLWPALLKWNSSFAFLVMSLHFVDPGCHKPHLQVLAFYEICPPPLYAHPTSSFLSFSSLFPPSISLHLYLFVSLTSLIPPLPRYNIPSSLSSFFSPSSNPLLSVLPYSLTSPPSRSHFFLSTFLPPRSPFFCTSCSCVLLWAVLFTRGGGLVSPGVICISEQGPRLQRNKPGQSEFPLHPPHHHHILSFLFVHVFALIPLIVFIGF